MTSLPFGLSSLRGYADGAGSGTESGDESPCGRSGFGTETGTETETDTDTLGTSPVFAQAPFPMVRQPVKIFCSVLPEMVYTLGFGLDALPRVAYALINCMLSSSAFVSVTHIHDELSLVVDEETLSLFLPHADVVNLHSQAWRVIEISEDSMQSAAGVFGRLSAPLAEHDISIFYLSTYASDYVLVPAAQVRDAIAALKSRYAVGVAGELPEAAPTSAMVAKFAAAGSSAESSTGTGLTEPAPMAVTWPAVGDALRVLAVPERRFTAVFGALCADLFVSANAAAGAGTRFFSLTKTADEISMLLEQRVVDALEVPGLTLWSHTWVPLRVEGNVGGGDGFTETGIVNRISAPLSRAGIPTFHLSTFASHFSLVRQQNSTDAAAALERSFQGASASV
ncbi:uncharacterized protein AMSG_03245 [Thecamonas trahens ATCC 50062]|uniref:CASTOR ACT domain-containing protein n=1 Tax=Thecamonas trahens ATCC 50062 TaxID=461836 RepID=A0A0L0D3D0_THETB|nr:hypothetical protein AMSG_03245 [Thecamonas trahens ATCC 50062]KNC46814.1 hypothetical protein AMSG_03245 [Thecamonas trahens ATCC 50062]|eukprot:XP_013760089.1 hypothetical protein AMSG_03245 [Thecamonas trahens ATCC 50062]